MDADGTNVRSVASIAQYPVINLPEVSPDGEWVAVDGWKDGQRSTDAHVLLIHLKTGIVADFGMGAMPTWSPDGQWLAWSRYRQADNKGGVFIGSVNQQLEKQIHEGGWAITWSPVGHHIAYVKQGDLIILDVISGVGHAVFGEGQSPYRYIMHNPKWSPDGQRICFIGHRHDGTSEFATVSADNDSDDADLQVCCSAQNFNPDIGRSNDGRKITFLGKASAGKRGQLWFYEFETKGEPQLLEGQPADRSNSGHDWSPDGKTLYFLSVK